MSRPEDHFTSTVDGAAAFERHHGPEYDDGRPDRREVEREEQGYGELYDGDQVVFSDGVPSGEPPSE